MEWLQSPWWWLVTTAIVLVPTVFVTQRLLPLALAAVAALGLSLMSLPVYGIVAGFVISAGIFAPLQIMWQRHARQRNTLPAMPDSTPGAELIDYALELKHDLPYGTGRVYINGHLWKVRSDNALAAGSAVRVTDVDGDTLVIQHKRLHEAGMQVHEA